MRFDIDVFQIYICCISVAIAE